MSSPSSSRKKLPRLTRFSFLVTVLGLLTGAVLWFTAGSRWAEHTWRAVLIVVLLSLAFDILSSLRRGEIGVDVIALLAMAGALALGEVLAGAVVALMLSGGEMLELYAAGRARKELASLVERAPRVVHRYEDGHLTEPAIEEVRPGDRLLVKPGEIVPVDGVVAGLDAVLDESALTGESTPVERRTGDRVPSGGVNAGGPFDLQAVATAEASTYAAIVRLVQEAEASRAPFVRLADRYSWFFLPLTLAVAGLGWLLSGDPVRALAVLVVATPCPLILAAPVAFVAGISRSARRGIIVKGGNAIEALASARTLLLDKTGTLTIGIPTVKRIETFGNLSKDELLHLAASLDQVSPHVLAAAIVRGARERGLALTFPTEVAEKLGTGIEGTVDGRRIALGKIDWIAAGRPLPARALEVRQEVSVQGLSNVFMGVDGEPAGVIVLEDPVREDSAATLTALRRLGIRRIVMVTGDHRSVGERVGHALGADAVLAECTPEDKVRAVHKESETAPTAMVGDGVNDAPALAAAGVGIAMGARGATASSEAADVVLMLDRLDRLVDALSIARRARAIARQSVLAGMGLSFAAMLVAAAGYLPPLAGALFQEAIDVAVILNALRALTGGRGEGEGVRGRVVGGLSRA
ncbi:MAG TPA: heavy metal translocating P-type ATPase [Thermoanaerobaculia bacterium]|nr:heavy metal translocating P-type ATPase [Thermoanaerobaculia bacterium]